MNCGGPFTETLGDDVYTNELGHTPRDLPFARAPRPIQLSARAKF